MIGDTLLLGLNLVGERRSFLLDSELLLNFKLLDVIEFVFILGANLVSQLLFLGIALIVLLMSIVLLLESLNIFIVLRCTLSSSDHGILRLKVEKVLGSHNSLKSVGNHNDCEIPPIGMRILGNSINGTLNFFLASRVKGTCGLV